MAVSDRSLFLEHIKTTPLTVKQIQDTFGVAPNTARSWITHPEVEQIAGSWPREYRRKSSFASDAEVVSSRTRQTPPSSNLVELPKVPLEVVDKLFHQVLDNDPDAQFNFTEQFRVADSLAALDKIENSLKVSMVIVRYQRKLMLDEGIE